MKDEMRAAYLRLRRDWGGVKPCTRIEKNKKKYSRKQKHRRTDEEK